jgi:hypothetical protein
MLFSTMICLPVSATIIDIPADYPTIQQGIDASLDGDTVLVQPGTYVENINFNGHNTVLGSLYLTTGDTSYVSTTIIDGNSQAPVITFASGEGNTAVISGFSIVNGFISGYGAGIRCINNSNPKITSNRIERNVAWKGAGLLCEDSSPFVGNNYFYADTSWHDGGAINCRLNSASIIVGNIFEANYGDCGAAICCEGSDALIQNNSMTGNFATYRGGAIACLYGSQPLIKNNTIKGNVADWGGGLLASYSDIVFSDNVVCDNSAYGGGGLFVSGSDESIIDNNVFNGNFALDHPYGGGLGGGIYCSQSDIPISNSIFWSDSAAVSGNEIHVDECEPTFAYSDIRGGWEGQGNIDLDPLFRDPENSDFHLMSTACGDPDDSPCIDAGDPNIVDILLDCYWGLGELRSDMGAYGGGDSVTVGIDYEDMPIPDDLLVFQNYPNPFNSNTTIIFDIQYATEIRINIYNLLGRRVTTLFDGNEPAGSHAISWEAGDLPSGIYFARLEAGEQTDNIKMVLLK